MLLDVIRSLYQYNAWANRRILQAASGVTPEQLLAPAGFSYPSLHAILVHTLSADQDVIANLEQVDRKRLAGRKVNDFQFSWSSSEDGG